MQRHFRRVMAGRRLTAIRLGEYYFGSDQFDNSEQSGFAELETVAVLNGEDGDLVSTETNTVFIAAATDPYLYDDDGNQLRVSTTTGSWQITYNGENRPVEWTDGDRVLLMAYDHQGRRRMYAEIRNGATNILHRFTYDDYLCIARNREIDYSYGGGAESFLWDPTEPVATRPLMCKSSTAPPMLYCHDGNKNVSDMVTMDGTVAAHYEYSSFGEVVMSSSGELAAGLPPHLLNPYRFSSEYHDDALGLVYYNYRHYNPGDGRWIGRDLLSEALLNINNVKDGVLVTQESCLYQYSFNRTLDTSDSLGAVIILNPFGIRAISTLIDPSWLNDLPDCPCSIPLDPSGCPVKNGLGDKWTTPIDTDHEGGTWECRSKYPTSSGAGQQCVYDGAGNLINQGPGAGTPDRISPPHTDPWDDLKKLNLSNLLRWEKHGEADYWQHWLGTWFDHWTHPPNKGKDVNGNPCPDNDGKSHPKQPNSSGCCKDK